MNPEVKKVLEKFSQDSLDKVELESKKVELKADALKKEAIRNKDNSFDLNDNADKMRFDAYALLNQIRDIKKKLEGVAKLGDRYFDEANEIFAEAEKKYNSLQRIKSDMKSAELDTSAIEKEIKSYSESLGLSGEASDAAEGAMLIAKEAIDGIKNI